ncbi:hypothetical protein J4221_07290 [Candidatus Pacearchaeota archaeon]|nr:hypothetical protein [Candidatus Pacearchaeota archaeon]
MPTLLESEVEETSLSEENVGFELPIINYPEIPEGFKGEICPYYANKECRYSLNHILKNLGYDAVQEDLKHCPHNFRECLHYYGLNIADTLPFENPLIILGDKK